MFTPVTSRSAIGRSARLVVRQLRADGHKVRVVRTESQQLRETPDGAIPPKTIVWTDQLKVREALTWADFPVYHLGDYFGFHEGALEWLAVEPGVVCLHDFFLGHLYQGWAQGREVQAQRLLERLYGPADIAVYDAHSRSQEFAAKTVNSTPLTEWIAQMASAVVVHSEWGAARIVAACPGPVVVAPLPYDRPKAWDHVVARPKDHDRIAVLTFGNINRNKRAESVIRAIAASADLRRRVTYRLVGDIQLDVADELNELADSLGVDLAILGAVDNEDLATELAAADIVSCLRWPSLEAASASAVEAMLCGKATIVTNTGFYQDLPDHVVVKIDPEDEVKALTVAIETLAADADVRSALGTTAATWAHDQFSAKAYADVLIAVGRTAQQSEALRRSFATLARFTAAWATDVPAEVMAHILDPLELFAVPDPVRVQNSHTMDAAAG